MDSIFYILYIVYTVNNNWIKSVHTIYDKGNHVRAELHIALSFQYSQFEQVLFFRYIVFCSSQFCLLVDEINIIFREKLLKCMWYWNDCILLWIWGKKILFIRGNDNNERIDWSLLGVLCSNVVSTFFASQAKFLFSVKCSLWILV